MQRIRGLRLYKPVKFLTQVQVGCLLFLFNVFAPGAASVLCSLGSSINIGLRGFHAPGLGLGPLTQEIKSCVPSMKGCIQPWTPGSPLRELFSVVLIAALRFMGVTRVIAL